MQKTIWLILVLLLTSCASSQRFTRNPHPINNTDFAKLPRVDWHFSNTNLILSSPYTPFFVDHDQLTLFSGGPGPSPGNGVFKMIYKLNERSVQSSNKVITTGPDPINYNYFRAARVARNGRELWMLIETAECYSGCDTTKLPRRLAVYHSKNNGDNWDFLDFLHADGKIYEGLWMAHTGLIFNPEGSAEIDTQDIKQNRFITVGENRNILVSANGIHYHSIPIEHPFPKDQLVFASIARTPFGFHLTSAASWDPNYLTTTIRHLFSKDLKHWIPIEFSSPMRNPKHFKGVHLSFDASTKKLWAVSSCGSKQACGLMGWIQAKDFSLIETEEKTSMVIPVGEYVSIYNQTAMVIESTFKNQQWFYKIRYANGVYDTDIPQMKLTLILRNYKRFGCAEDRMQLCIGDSIKSDNDFGSIIGIDDSDLKNPKYAVKLLDGTVFTDVQASRIQRP